MYNIEISKFLINRLQRYVFLRTQPNKMHKNHLLVHKPGILCKPNFAFLSFFRNISFGEVTFIRK